MKTLLFSFFVFVFSAAPLMSRAQSEKPRSFIATGKVQFLNPPPYDHLNKVWIYKLNGSKSDFTDSTGISADGTWKLTMPKGDPDLYVIDIAKWDRVTVYSDGNVNIDSRGYDTAKIKIKNPPYVFVEGTPANNFINLVSHLEYMNYQQMIADGKEMYYAGQSKDTAWKTYLKEKDPYGRLNQDYLDRLNVLIRAYRDQPVVVYALGLMNWEKNQDMIMSVLNNLNQKYPDDNMPREFKNVMMQRISQAKKLKPGSPVPELELVNSAGKKSQLSQFNKRTLLIDFWASWCGPCRASIPRLKEIYNAYHKDGFDIVSISIDDSKDAWKKAMADEKMPWHQFLSPDKMVTMQTFLFGAIPTLYLIDDEGKIVTSFSGLTDDAIVKIKAELNKKKKG